MLPRSYEVLGIGSPCLDYILKVSDDFLEKISGPKEGMIPVDYDIFYEIVKDSGVVPVRVSGGSACNTVKGLAMFGRGAAMLGKVGQDIPAKFIRDNLDFYHITPLFSESSTFTTQVACLVNPEGKRTFRTYLGAGGELKPQDLNPSFFEGVKLVHIEGYSLVDENTTLRAMELAKSAGSLLSFDLSSFEIVTLHREKILFLIENYVDILFANQSEIQALVNLDPKQGCDMLKKMTQVCVVFIGSQGCWIGQNEVTQKFPAYPVEALDTTGAGDLFASGFLDRYLAGDSLAQCAHYGAVLGAEVVQFYGAEIPFLNWKKLNF